MDSPLPDSCSCSPLLKRSSLYALFVSLFLIMIKIFAFTITGSMAILSSLLDSCMDALASFLNFFTIRLSLIPADSDHRFGHGKIEALGSLVQAAFIAGSAIFIIVSIIDRTIHSKEIIQENFGIIVCLVSMFLTFLLVTYQNFVIRKTKSLAIEADSLHYRGDFLLNASVILSLVLTKYLNTTIFDSIIAGLIVLYLFYNSLQITKKSLSMLLDKEIDQSERTKIKEIILSHHEVLGIHHFRTRKSGQTYFVQVDIELNPHLTLKDAHKICEDVERELYKVFPQIDLMIHQDLQGKHEGHPHF